MDPTPPLLRRLSPGAWAALAWCAAMVFWNVAGVQLPGEAEDFRPARHLLNMPAENMVNLLVAGLLTLAGCLLLCRRPMTSLVLLLLGAVASAMALNSAEITFAEFLPAEVGLGYIAATQPRRSSIAAAVLALATLGGFAVVRLSLGFVIGTTTLLLVALTAVVVWLAGNSVRQSRDHARTLQDQAITTERLRIARELHDMVAHSIGIIAIQSGAASMVIDTRPAHAKEALLAIESASRETLAGLRRMLIALRQAEAAPLGSAPAPGLADVERLAETTAAAGVHIDVQWRGHRNRLPAEIDLSAFRIIQESVTNVVRHAGTRECRVLIERGKDDLSIEVVDSGQGGQPGGTGFGIVGMRERVGLLHGDFSAGPRPGGGFRVAARLPVEAETR